MNNNKGFFDRVYKVVATIPYGRVMSYGQIALVAGNPRASRSVGWALHKNPSPGVIPCHRVVNQDGRIAKTFAFGGPDVQKDLLLSEGVAFVSHDRVDMSKHVFIPNINNL